MTNFLKTPADGQLLPAEFFAEVRAFDQLYITSDRRQALEKKYKINTETLLKGLVNHISEAAIATISNFHVGVAGLGSSGNIYFGINLEFLHLQINQTVHGEQFMICNAYSHDEKAIVMLAVNAAPCGHCRQFLNELAAPHKVQVCIVNLDIRESLTNLLPYSFGPRDLGASENLLSTMNHNLTIGGAAKSATDPLIQAALAAANRSYTPYTDSPSGVAILVKTGNKIYFGSYLENAAYNPSLSPFQAALINMISHGNRRNFESEIVRVALIEKHTNSIVQREATELILSKLAPKATFLYLVLD